MSALPATASQPPEGAPPPHPSGLTIRKLEIDLSQGFGRHWHGGDAFLSQFFNALSMSFPVGEQSFIDAVRECVRLLPDEPEHAMLQETAARFIAQEATHRHIHSLYNSHLAKQGLVNRWEPWVTRRLRIARGRGMNPLHFLAITAAYEHLTAVLSDYVLRHDRSLDQAEPAMQTLWRWHAAEETEHRALAFDVYTAVSGNHGWRVRWYTYVLIVFTLDCSRQTLINLWHDGSLFRPGTWWSAAKFFLGHNGMLRRCGLQVLSYYRRDFHPDQEVAQPTTEALAQQWLREHADSFRVVR